MPARVGFRSSSKSICRWIDHCVIVSCKKVAGWCKSIHLTSLHEGLFQSCPWGEECRSNAPLTPAATQPSFETRTLAYQRPNPWFGAANQSARGGRAFVKTLKMASPAARLGSAFYYGAASLTVQFVIKTLITTYQFNFPMCIALSQMMFMCPVCYLVAKPKFEWKTVQAILPLAAINVMNLVSGLIGTGGLNVPMFIALRRFTLLLTVLLELFWFGKRHSRTTYFAVTIMIMGALIAALSDLTFNLRGYVAVFTNNLFTAAYLVMIKNVKTAKDLSTTGLLFYNSMMSVPLLFVAVLLSRELNTLQTYPRLGEFPLRILVVASSVLGMTINHAQFLCTRLNEPIMTSVAGQLKNMVSTIAGALVFGDFVFSIVNVGGLAVSMSGSVIYAAHSALRKPKPETLPLKSTSDGYIGDKLKNYTPLSTKVDGGVPSESSK